MGRRLSARRNPSMASLVLIFSVCFYYLLFFLVAVDCDSVYKQPVSPSGSPSSSFLSIAQQRRQRDIASKQDKRQQQPTEITAAELLGSLAPTKGKQANDESGDLVVGHTAKRRRQYGAEEERKDVNLASDTSVQRPRRLIRRSTEGGRRQFGAGGQQPSSDGAGQKALPLLSSEARLTILGKRMRRSTVTTAASRRKPPRVQLAQRPKGTTTTTTTTTTTASTKEEEEETAGGNGAEEESRDSSEKGGSPKASKGSAAAAATTVEEVEYEVEEGDESDGGNETSSTTPASKSSKQRQQQQMAVTRETTEADDDERPPSKSTRPPIQAAPAKAKAGRTKGDGAAQAATKPKGDDKSSKEMPDVGATAAATVAATGTAQKKKKPLVALPFIRPKNSTACTPEAYLEFPADLVGNKWRGRGLVLIHIAVVCYMFYSLALVCERYFMPSLEEFAQRLQLSEDVAGATLMSAGSSAPELFTAILGVFVAKGDVGTGTIVGSAVFNILFVIGICAFVTTSSAQLNWWPVLRDSVFYTFTVLVLIMFIYDERITAIESFLMIALYGVYILIMMHNEHIKELVTRALQSHPLTSKLIGAAVAAAGGATAAADGPDDVFGSTSSSTRSGAGSRPANYQTTSLMAHKTTVEEDSMFMAALLVIVRHKRLFPSQLRFQSATRYIIIKRQHRVQLQQRQKQQKSIIKCSNEVNYFGPDESEPLKSSSKANNQRDRMEAYARTQSSTLSKSKFSIVSKEDYEPWNRPPEEGENYYVWLAKIPVNYVLHYTIPDCALYPDKYLFTFCISIAWTALFSYIMVWMVTLIGFTLGIPDSVMGVTFLAAGTSVPDCYSSIHAARNGMVDMAVSNSIGSNVFDILIGLSLPWFIQTAIYPGVVATINSRGVIYSVILLFLSLIVTIYLMNKYEWTLKPRLGLALLIAYGLFIVLTCMLEFNLFGHVNPPPCPIG